MTIVDKLSGALVNTDGIPNSLTTISPDLTAVYSSQILRFDGSVLAPSQDRGKCEYGALKQQDFGDAAA